MQRNYMEINKTSLSGNPPTADILGVEIQDITVRETLNVLKEMVEDGRPHHVMTVNPEFIMMAKRNEEFREVLRTADLRIPDGVGILLGARLLGFSMRERVTGVDIVRQLARVARDHQFSMFFLGAAPGIAEQAAQILQQENPGLTIAGTFAGSPRIEDEETICSLIEKSKPHILLVAYGPPKQDLWIARTQTRLKVPVAIGVGGTFDFITGIVPRAPLWMQRNGLEWLFRLVRQPWRWKRQLTLPEFVFAILTSKVRRIFINKGISS
jgi:N-acetylglucosaminyldiphosphoundecaprenol N-acetyl-beta-D-mannosaminyltransferase